MNVNNMWLTSRVRSLAKATRQEMFSPIRCTLARGEASGFYAHKRVLDHLESQNPTLYMQNGGQATFRPTGLAEEKKVCRKG